MAQRDPLSLAPQLIDQYMTDQYMIDQHMIDQHMIDQHMIDQHMIDHYRIWDRIIVHYGIGAIASSPSPRVRMLA